MLDQKAREILEKSYLKSGGMVYYEDAVINCFNSIISMKDTLSPEAFKTILKARLKKELKNARIKHNKQEEKVNINKDVASLCTKWEKEIGPLTEFDREGIYECHRILKARGLPADVWLYDAYRIIKRKIGTGSLDPSKSTLVGYMVSMIRNWEAYGKGHAGGWQDKVIMSYLENLFNIKLTEQHKRAVYTLMGELGAFAVYLAIKDCRVKKYGTINNFLNYRVRKRAQEIINS